MSEVETETQRREGEKGTDEEFDGHPASRGADSASRQANCQRSS